MIYFAGRKTRIWGCRILCSPQLGFCFDSQWYRSYQVATKSRIQRVYPTHLLAKLFWCWWQLRRTWCKFFLTLLKHIRTNRSCYIYHNLPKLIRELHFKVSTYHLFHDIYIVQILKSSEIKALDIRKNFYIIEIHIICCILYNLFMTKYKMNQIVSI